MSSRICRSERAATHRKGHRDCTKVREHLSLLFTLRSDWSTTQSKSESKDRPGALFVELVVASSRPRREGAAMARGVTVAERRVRSVRASIVGRSRTIS
jgi:hypothetical protein